MLTDLSTPICPNDGKKQSFACVSGQIESSEAPAFADESLTLSCSWCRPAYVCLTTEQLSKCCLPITPGPDQMAHMPSPRRKSNLSCNCCPQLLSSMPYMLSETLMLVIKQSGFEHGKSNLNVEWPGARPRTKKQYVGTPPVTVEQRDKQEGEETASSWASMGLGGQRSGRQGSRAFCALEDQRIRGCGKQ